MTTLFHLEVYPVTASRWPDVEALFSEGSVSNRCWCMYWRLPRSQYTTQKGQANRAAFRTIVSSGEIPGLLAYHNGQPIAWCALAPREHYPALERSRTLQRVDSEPVWSITCVFVATLFRRQGVTYELLQAAVAYAKEQGATIVEGYPYDPQEAKLPDVYGATGLVSVFEKVGFIEVARRTASQPIMRFRCAWEASGKGAASMNSRDGQPFDLTSDALRHPDQSPQKPPK